MRVYKFLNCKYGLRALRQRRLKISEIGSLNDPFDLIPVDLSDARVRMAFLHNREQLGKKQGLLCFSRTWHNPVLWAHYSESHRGLCLGFEIPEGGPTNRRNVEYVDQLIKLPDNLDLEFAEGLLFSKYAHWGYEDEVRLWVALEEKSGDFFFHDFDHELLLCEVIVGAGNRTSKRRIAEALGSRQSAVRIMKARLAYDAFKVVEDEEGFGW